MLINSVSTNDWNDGIFSALWRRTMKGKKGEYFWIVLDGPVDPNWIENLNSVLDDSKILTLANGDRLSLPPTVKLIFEPENLDNASPATVSRCGMVYMSSDGLHWEPRLESWIMQQYKKLTREQCNVVRDLFKASFAKVHKWATANLHFVMNILQVHILNTLFVLIEAIHPSMHVEEEDAIKIKTTEVKKDTKTKQKAAPTPPQEEVKESPKKENKSPRKENNEEESDSDTDDEKVVDDDEEDWEQTYIFALCWAFGGYLEDPGMICCPFLVPSVSTKPNPSKSNSTKQDMLRNFCTDPYFSFLAAASSSGCRDVGRSVVQLVGPSIHHKRI